MPDVPVVGESVGARHASERRPAHLARVARAALAKPWRCRFVNLGGRSPERRRHRWQTPRYEDRLRVVSVKRYDVSRPWYATDRNADVAPHEPGPRRSHEPGATDLGERSTADGAAARRWTVTRHQAGPTARPRIPLA